MPDVIAIAGQLLLFALVFGMSATVDMQCLVSQLRNHRAILTGVLCQFLLLPTSGLAVVKLLDLPYELGIPLLVVTSSPGGSYSNWWCSLFNADLALSVTMTAISTILSIFMLPMNLLLTTSVAYRADVLQLMDWTGLFVALIIVIAAIAVGLTCSAKIHSRRFNRAANQCGNVAGLSLIIFSATMTNTGDADTKIWSRDWSFYVGVALPCLLGLVLANVVATSLRLPTAERMTVSIEACYQNVGIATSLALTMFEGNALNAAMGVPFFYGVVEAVFVGIYCVAAWKCGWSKAPANAPLWKVLWESYEVLEYEQRDVEEIEIGVYESNESDEPDKRHGNTLFTYFNLAWIGGDPKTCCDSPQTSPEKAPKQSETMASV
jgi:predicted Na+-dependent transporter